MLVPVICSASRNLQQDDDDSNDVTGNLFFDWGRLLCQTNVLQLCVCSESGLRQAVLSASSNNPNDPTVVRICRNSVITLQDNQLDISNKAIDIRCNGAFWSWLFPMRCTIDGKALASFRERDRFWLCATWF